MKRVDLNMKEKSIYEIIKRLVDTNGNKNEDDMSTANIIIGVKTGGVALYITITLVCIVVLAGGSYIINKKVLRGIK